MRLRISSGAVYVTTSHHHQPHDRAALMRCPTPAVVVRPRAARGVPVALAPATSTLKIASLRSSLHWHLCVVWDDQSNYGSSSRLMKCAVAHADGDVLRESSS